MILFDRLSLISGESRVLAVSEVVHCVSPAMALTDSIVSR